MLGISTSKRDTQDELDGNKEEDQKDHVDAEGDRIYFVLVLNLLLVLLDQDVGDADKNDALGLGEGKFFSCLVFFEFV